MKKLVLIAGFYLVACSSEPKQSEMSEVPKPAPTSLEAQQMAAEQQASYVTELSFAKNSTQLNEANKSKIQQIVGQAERDGKVKEVMVITWADLEYPSVHTKKLSSSDRQLVKNRNKSIENFFETMPGNMKVSFHSMAERPNTLKEMLSTTDARIKKSLEVAGIPTTDTTVKVPSKASKSIVMIFLEDRK